MNEDTKCWICGYSTNLHHIHAENGKCYCIPHYVMYVFNKKSSGASQRTST
ncbi:MAG: hypothetical protein ACTSQE_02195 [Candidatus Heimdallarchaeaceae archaeon]